MRITGRFEEIYFLFQKAVDSKAELLHFAPNGDVWMLYKTESYVYLRSHLDITHSVLFAKNAMDNMHRLLKRARETKRQKNLRRIHYPLEVVEIGPEYMEFDYDKGTRVNVFTRMEHSDSALDLSHRLKRLSTSVVELDKPYIRITPKLIKEYISRFSKDVREGKLSVEKEYVFDPHADESRNHLYMQDYEFAITRRDGVSEEQTYTFDDGYFVPRFFKSINIHLSDSDLLFMSRVAAVMTINEYFIIPFSSHYIVEAHDGLMTFKMSMPRLKRIELEELL